MTAYVFTLDGYTFPTADKPARGPVIYHQPQRWSELDPIGNTATDATILTFLGLKSQRWQFTSRACAATKNKLLAVYTARLPVIFKTPQDGTGVDVLMTELEIEYAEPIEDSKFLCRFTLVGR